MALESRCITEIITETTRTDIPTDLGATYRQEKMELQNKLLMYRLRNWDKVIPDENLKVDFGRIQPRIKQTFLPFFVLFQNDEFMRNDFIETVKEYNKKLTVENSTSYDGVIFESYITLLKDDYSIITTQDIRNKLVNTHGYDPDKTNSRGIGKRLKTLGFGSVSKRIGTQVKRLVTIDVHTAKRLIYRYVEPDEQNEVVKLIEKTKGQTELQSASDCSSSKGIDSDSSSSCGGTSLGNCDSAIGTSEVES